jgi:hypothetical protein
LWYLKTIRVVIIYLSFFFLCIIKYVLFFKNWSEKLLFPQEGENQAIIIWLQGQEHLPHVQITVTGGDETFGRVNIDSDNVSRPTYNEKGGERTGEAGLLQSVLQLTSGWHPYGRFAGKAISLALSDLKLQEECANHTDIWLYRWENRTLCSNNLTFDLNKQSRNYHSRPFLPAADVWND